MSFHINILNTLSAILLVSLTLAFGGCSLVTDDDLPCPDPVSDEFVRFEFKVVSPNLIDDNSGKKGTTRTDSQGHDEEDAEWLSFENGIDVTNFAFYVFYGSEPTAPLLMKVTDIANSTDPDMMITGSGGAYTVSFVIQKNRFEQLLGRELDPSSDTAVQFRLVGVANIQNSNAQWYPDLQIYNNVDCSTYQSLIDGASQWTFDMGQIYSPNEGSHTLDGMYKENIPMYGTMILTTTERELRESRNDNRIWFGTMWMLRSVAKIRVVDMIESKDKTTGLPRVEQALFLGSANMLYPLPYNAIGYQNESQVHQPKVCTDDGYTSPGFIKDSFFLGTYNGSSSNTLIGYVPEQIIEDETPSIQITVTFTEQTDRMGNLVPDKQETYVVPLTGYKDQVLDFGDAILRNHIYTLQVNDAKTGFPADISIRVEDWTEESLTLDYTDTETVSQTIRWTSGYAGPESIDMTEGWIVAQPWHDGEPVALECSFGINNPLGATWTATLIARDNPGAFKFLDADGNEVDAVSGEIDGSKLSTLRIVTTNADPKEQSSAYLQIILNVNGQFREVNICGDRDYTNFMIIQNPQ